MYEIDARATLRSFLRKIKKNGQVTTAKGNANYIAGITNLSIHLRTDQSRKAFCLKYKVIRLAIQYTFYARTITRKDLDQYTKGANSALFGILIEIFGDLSKVTQTASGLIRLSLRGVRYFFAGVDRAVNDLEAAAANGAKFVLMSYFHIRSRKAWRNHVLRLGLKVLLDSGAFTLWKAAETGKNVTPIKLEEYASFINEHKDLLYGWFNLDVIGDPEASKSNAKRLKELGLSPIEVWHAGNNIRDLSKLVAEDHAVIAIGGSVGMSEKRRKRIFRWVFKCFPSQNFHFLGGSSQLLWKYDWFSADSTGWLVGRKYLAIIDEFGQRPAKQDPNKQYWNKEQCRDYNIRYLVGLECRVA